MRVDDLRALYNHRKRVIILLIIINELIDAVIIITSLDFSNMVNFIRIISVAMITSFISIILLNKYLTYNTSLTIINDIEEIFEDFTLFGDKIFAKYKADDRIFLIIKLGFFGSAQYYLFAFKNFVSTEESEKYPRMSKGTRTELDGFKFYKMTGNFVIPTPNGNIDGEGTALMFNNIHLRMSRKLPKDALKLLIETIRNEL